MDITDWLNEENNNPQVIIFVGYPGSGKSFLASTQFAGLGYVQANRDTVGSWQKCVSVMEKALQVRRKSSYEHLFFLKEYYREWTLQVDVAPACKVEEMTAL